MRRLFVLCILMTAVLLVNAINCSAANDVQTLIKKLKSPNAEQRASAASSLGNMGQKAAAAIPYLIKMLDDYSWVEIRDGKFISKTCPSGEAQEALSKIGTSSVEPLIAAFKDKTNDWRVRMRAAIVFGDLRDPRATEPLIESLKCKDDSLFTRETITALSKITGQNFGEDHIKWREWYNNKAK